METMTLTTSWLDCPPRVATRRTDRPTDGHKVAAIAETLGKPLYPWQRYVADVALELKEDGRPAYREVVLTVPRQQGKSTLALSLMLYRVLHHGDGQLMVYSAQTGKDARERIKFDYGPALKSSPFKAILDRIYIGNGSESIIFRNGGRVVAMSSGLDAGHGLTLSGGAILDEAFADIDDRREGAVLPAMMTCPTAQLWVVSTAGEPTSVYLKRKVALGRELVREDVTEGTAFFEWGADEDDDIDDLETWRRAMPGLGLSVDEGTIRHFRQTLAEPVFRRTVLNQWVDHQDDRVIPLDIWQDAQHGDTAPEGNLFFAPDITLDRAKASIVVADNEGRLELIDNRDGTAWLVDRLEELVKKHDGRIVLDGYGPAGLLGDELEKRKLPVTRYTTRDVTYAANAFYDALIERQVTVRPAPELDEAIAAARKKPVGSGWLWSRHDPAADLSPLHAATLAYHAARTKQITKRRPMVL